MKQHCTVQRRSQLRVRIRYRTGVIHWEVFIAYHTAVAIARQQTCKQYPPPAVKVAAIPADAVTSAMQNLQYSVDLS